MVIQSIYNYAIHLLSGLAMVGVFAVLYVRTTPFCEISLIRRGCVSALLSFGGATLGFSLTVASSIFHNHTFTMFVIWAVFAMIVQLLTYAIVSRALPNMNEALETNNIAMGGLMGVISLVVGIVNAACLS